jgi:phosphodiesterase/alkaline phosphatase D-like protein
MEDDLRKFYFDLYVTRWSQPEIARMLAQVPMVAMWDDHDIMDGWGSYPPERQNCPVFNRLWPIAREAFAVFQQQIELKAGEHIDDALAPEYGFSRCHKLGRLAVLALDMRSERTADQVIGLNHWNQIFSRMSQASPHFCAWEVCLLDPGALNISATEATM